MNLNPEEISSIIKAEIRHFENKTEQSEIGTVILVGDGIARAHGLSGCMASELLEFEGGDLGMAQNLEAIRVSRALLQVVTPLKIYNNMVLSDLVILQEEGKPNSWTGTLSFTEVEPNNGSEKTSDNSSAVTDTGTAVTQTVASGSNSSSSASGSSSVSGSGSSSGSSSGGIIYDSPLRQLLQKAGIELTN